MAWPIPAAGEIAERYALAFERAFQLDERGVPYPEPPDTRSPNSAFRVLGVVGEETHTELYLYQRWLADELMPDRATDWLPRHASEWGVPPLPPLTSLGSLIFVGPPAPAPDLVLPFGIECYGGSGLRWVTRAGATVPAGGAVEVPAEAVQTGPASDLAAGELLPLVSPVAGLALQSATVGAEGFRGGRGEEGVEGWRGRILRRIRERGRAGNRSDYVDWASEAGAVHVAVLPGWIGAGTVGLAVAMATAGEPRVPTSPELERIRAAVDLERPVTAEVVVFAASLLAVPVTLAISPDTVLGRLAVGGALRGLFAREAAIGRTIPRSRLSEAISSATGEYAHRIDLPAGDFVPGPTQLPILGAVTFVSGGVPAAPA